MTADAATRNRSPVETSDSGAHPEARFLVQGSIRNAGSSIRAAIQLVDAESGAHLWAERFDRDLGAGDIFGAQDELTDRIVATIADPFGILTRSLCTLVKEKSIDSLTAHECVLRTFAYWRQVQPVEHAEVRAALEQVVRREPSHADALACLSILYLEEFYAQYNPLPNSLERGLEAAQRAVALDTTSQLAYRALAFAHFFRRDFAAFRMAADRVLALNPRDTLNVGMVGAMIGNSGDWEAGLSALRRVMRLNPHHPGMLDLPFMWDHYHKGEYDQAIDVAEKVNIPGFSWMYMGLAAAHAQLGNAQTAKRHLKAFVDAAPDFTRDAPVELSKWFFPELAEDILDGLRKAGLKVEGGAARSASTPENAVSEANSAAAGIPRLAVLPLKTRADDPEMESFAEGLTEEITSGLSQFRHLVVLSSSDAADLRKKSDARQAGTELGTRFVLEGSIRKAGSRIRVSMHLVDASTGGRLWAERFDRDMSSADIFEVQDELSDRIVATVADSAGVLTRSLSSFAKTKPIDSLTAHEAVLRMYGYWLQLRREEHREVRTALERALEREPNHAEALACLAIIYVSGYRFNYNPRPDPLTRALELAERAVALDVTSQLAYRALADTQFHRRNLIAFRSAADRAIELNRRDTMQVAIMGMLIAFSGDWAHGRRIVDRVAEMNPHHLGLPLAASMWAHYRKKEYALTLEIAERINMPVNPWKPAILAMTHGQLGNTEIARQHLERYLELYPEAAQNAREEWSKWFLEEEMVDHVLDGLRKAGLEVA